MGRAHGERPINRNYEGSGLCGCIQYPMAYEQVFPSGNRHLILREEIIETPTSYKQEHRYKNPRGFHTRGGSLVLRFAKPRILYVHFSTHSNITPEPCFVCRTPNTRSDQAEAPRY